MPARDSPTAGITARSTDREQQNDQQENEQQENDYAS
jgi:hypothetical protein